MGVLRRLLRDVLRTLVLGGFSGAGLLGFAFLGAWLALAVERAHESGDKDGFFVVASGVALGVVAAIVLVLFLIRWLRSHHSWRSHF
jgi:threonine/homoserine/homoserine lactone efflux protein